MAPEGVVRAYFEQFEAGNPVGIAALFAADAAFMPNGLATIRGRPAIREAFEWITAAAELTCDELIFDRVLELPGAAVIETRTFETITSRAGGTTGRDEFRELFFLADTDGEWRIVSYMGNRPNRPPTG